MCNKRGSLWNKWDLHIHTPKSICNNYGGDTEEIWDKYIEALESLPEEVKVIGINDYYFIDGFEKVMEYKMEKGRLKNIEKIFPVLEFRIDTFASASESKFQKINFHILFNMNDLDWRREVNKIKDEFIKQIHMSKLEQHRTKILSRENFSECGNGDVQVGFSEIIPSTEEVLNIIDSQTWSNKVFTFLGYKEWNNLEKGNQLKQFKEELYKKVNAFFTASPDDSFSKKQKVLEMFGDKVLVHSDDIHSFEKLSVENYRCLTWIKAEETFEGLRQIIFEPKERIKIQENSPDYDENKTLILDSLTIKNKKDWFRDEEICLNRGLVSIIGEKGAGKTALLDLLAVSNGEGIYEQDIKNAYSFYNRAKNDLIGAKIEIKHVGKESIEEYSIDGSLAKDKTDSYANVRYLSLKEVESYCDKKEKFQSFIKEIIHSKCSEVSDFDKLSDNIISQIKSINNDMVKVELVSEKYPIYLNALSNRKDELEMHCKNEPKVKTNFNVEQEKEFKELLMNEQKLNYRILNNNKYINELNDIEKWIFREMLNFENNFKNRFEIQINNYSRIDKDMFNTIGIEVNIKGREEISKRIEYLNHENTIFREDLINIKKKLQPLEELNKSFNNEKSITKMWLENKNKIENDLKDLEKSISNLQENMKQIKSLKEQRLKKYKELLSNKLKQKQKYEELKSELETDSNIEFKVKIEFNSERFFEKEDSIIKHGLGNSQEMIRKILNSKFLDGLRNIDNKKEDGVDEISKVIKQLDDEEFLEKVFGKNRNKENLFKKNFTMEDLYNWILDDYYDVNYFINFKGKALETLSPGQKGLVLMKVFLKLDNSQKPLLIDQPEDNLDNKSVFNDLVNDFREMKKKRQIIIATHNPNLVVNTDSEQVIVAKFEDNPREGKPKITYKCGALEDEKIKRLVCDILEGGDRAFIKREKRYSLTEKEID